MCIMRERDRIAKIYRVRLALDETSGFSEALNHYIPCWGELPHCASPDAYPRLYPTDSGIWDVDPPTEDAILECLDEQWRRDEDNRETWARYWLDAGRADT